MTKIMLVLSLLVSASSMAGMTCVKKTTDADFAAVTSKGSPLGTWELDNDEFEMIRKIYATEKNKLRMETTLFGNSDISKIELCKDDQGVQFIKEGSSYLFYSIDGDTMQSENRRGADRTFNRID